MQTSADLLLDTSAAIALLDEAHPGYAAVQQKTTGLTLGLAGHALGETYSVLTRLPGQKRVSARTAAILIEREFPRSVAMPPSQALASVEVLAEAGVSGGAVYDGLVGLAARVAGITLLSRDFRAAKTYAALAVGYLLV